MQEFCIVIFSQFCIKARFQSLVILRLTGSKSRLKWSNMVNFQLKRCAVDRTGAESSYHFWLCKFIRRRKWHHYYTTGISQVAKRQFVQTVMQKKSSISFFIFIFSFCFLLVLTRFNLTSTNYIEIYLERRGVVCIARCACI